MDEMSYFVKQQNIQPGCALFYNFFLSLDNHLKLNFFIIKS